MEPGEARNTISQLRRGTLPYCVLSILREGERYGFELVGVLADIDGMVTREGTVYPLLSRLRRQGLVETAWRESTAGPPRKYYSLTDEGHRALTDFAAEWRRFRDSVDSLLQQTDDHDMGES